MFRCSECRLRSVFYHFSDYLLRSHGHLLDFRADTFKHRLPDFKAAFCLKAGIPNVNGDVLGSCFGSVDGSRYFICRPEPNVLPPGTTRHSLQYEVFSGHKWQHCIAGQSVSFLNGMMAFHGFAPGRRSDSYLMSLSSVPLELPLLVDQYGIQHYITADTAYPASVGVMPLFKRNISDYYYCY